MESAYDRHYPFYGPAHQAGAADADSGAVIDTAMVGAAVAIVFTDFPGLINQNLTQHTIV